MLLKDHFVMLTTKVLADLIDTQASTHYVILRSRVWDITYQGGNSSWI